MIQGVSNNLVNSNKYVVRFAGSLDEMQAAQQLRYQVFNLELGEGSESASEGELDADQYDEQCHHLLVIERETESVIGTYRMQTHNIAAKNKGFYTAREFKIDSIPDEILKTGVEVGRACIQKEHRNGRVLFLLWRGLAEYMRQKKARYLFGCCSISSQNAREAWEVMDYLRKNDHVHPKIQLGTTSAFECPEVTRSENAWKNVKLPQLFRLYLDLGTKVCSEPALDRNFRTIDYLILLDIESLDERSRLLFFK